jgi:hypothetical protein
MKNYFIVGLILMIGIVSCQKEDHPESKSVSQDKTLLNYFPVTTGSYWVYNTYEIDSTGNETLFSESDTVAVVGDTLLNGKEYKVFYGKYYKNSYSKKYYRDSAGYIINRENKIIFNPNNFADTLNKEVQYLSNNKLWFISFILMKKVDSSVTVPTGKYDKILNSEFIIEVNDSLKTKMCFDYLYAPNIGIVLSQHAWFEQYLQEKKYYERRLISFNVVKNIED